MNVKDLRRTGECCVVYPDGSVSGDALVEEMLAGVDDYDFCMQDKARLIARGVLKAVADRLIPEE